MVSTDTRLNSADPSKDQVNTAQTLSHHTFPPISIHYGNVIKE